MSEAFALSVPEEGDDSVAVESSPTKRTRQRKKGTDKIGQKTLQVVETPAEPQIPPGHELVKVGDAEVLLTHRINEGGTYAEGKKRHARIFRGFTDPNRHS